MSKRLPEPLSMMHDKYGSRDLRTTCAQCAFLRDVSLVSDRRVWKCTLAHEYARMRKGKGSRVTVSKWDVTWSACGAYRVREEATI